MPSPFPGMNPFLEQSDAWPDFHNDYIEKYIYEGTPEPPLSAADLAWANSFVPAGSR